MTKAFVISFLIGWNILTQISVITPAPGVSTAEYSIR